MCVVVVAKVTKPIPSSEISCNVPDCNFFCHSVMDYEAHYNAQHRYTCGQCKKSLPNAHLLDLHLSETHDSYFAAQVQSASRAMVTFSLLFLYNSILIAHFFFF